MRPLKKAAAICNFASTSVYVWGGSEAPGHSICCEAAKPSLRDRLQSRIVLQAAVESPRLPVEPDSMIQQLWINAMLWSSSIPLTVPKLGNQDMLVYNVSPWFMYRIAMQASSPWGSVNEIQRVIATGIVGVVHLHEPPTHPAPTRQHSGGGNHACSRHIQVWAIWFWSLVGWHVFPKDFHESCITSYCNIIFIFLVFLVMLLVEVGLGDSISGVCGCVCAMVFVGLCFFCCFFKFLFGKVSGKNGLQKVQFSSIWFFYLIFQDFLEKYVFYRFSKKTLSKNVENDIFSNPSILGSSTENWQNTSTFQEMIIFTRWIKSAALPAENALPNIIEFVISLVCLKIHDSFKINIWVSDHLPWDTTWNHHTIYILYIYIPAPPKRCQYDPKGWFMGTPYLSFSTL